MQRPPLHEQLDREPAFAHADVAALDRGDERPLDLGAGRVAARVHDPRERVTALAGEQQLVAVGTGRGVEVRAERRELAHPIRTFGHQHPDRFDVAQSRARGERVGEVELGGVGLGQRGGDAALRVAGGRQRQLALGQHDRRQALPRGLERGRETGDTAPENENVDHGISLRGRACALRRRSGPVRIHTRFEPDRATACSCGIGRLHSSTCTITGSYSANSASS